MAIQLGAYRQQNLFSITFTSNNYNTQDNDVGYTLVAAPGAASTVTFKESANYKIGDKITIYNSNSTDTNTLTLDKDATVTLIPATIAVTANSTKTLTYTATNTWSVTSSYAGEFNPTDYFNLNTDDSDDITQGSTNLFLTTAERTKLTNVPNDTNSSLAAKQNTLKIFKATFNNTSGTPTTFTVTPSSGSAITSGTAQVNTDKTILTISLTHASGTVYGSMCIFDSNGKQYGDQTLANSMTTTNNSIVVTLQNSDLTLAQFNNAWTIYFMTIA